MSTKVFICSPYTGDIEKNTETARIIARNACLLGYVPIVPHLKYTQFLRDDVDNERALGIKLGIKELSECKRLWVFNKDGVSRGMRKELEAILLSYSKIEIFCQVKPKEIYKKTFAKNSQLSASFSGPPDAYEFVSTTGDSFEIKNEAGIQIFLESDLNLLANPQTDISLSDDTIKGLVRYL